MSGRNAKAMKEGFAAQDDANSAVTTIKQDKNNVDQARIQAEQKAVRIQQEKDAADQARIQAEQKLQQLQGSNSPTGSDDSQCKIDLGHNLIIKQKLLSKPVTQAMLGMVCNADKTPKDGGTLTVDELRDEGVDIVGECGGLA